MDARENRRRAALSRVPPEYDQCPTSKQACEGQQGGQGTFAGSESDPSGFFSNLRDSVQPVNSSRNEYFITSSKKNLIKMKKKMGQL